MAERKIRLRPVRRQEVDIDKLVAGLLALMQEEAERGRETDQGSGEEPAA